VPVSLLDELEAFVRARLAAAAQDKALYERNGARLNAQLLQGEINLGTAVLAWLARARAGVDTAAVEEEEEPDLTAES
jgi:hypothetical protein